MQAYMVLRGTWVEFWVTSWRESNCGSTCRNQSPFPVLTPRSDNKSKIACLEQRLLPGRVGPRLLDPEVFVRQMRSHAAARRAVEKANLHEEIGRASCRERV